jgi:hypothetical protein
MTGREKKWSYFHPHAAINKAQMTAVEITGASFAKLNRRPRTRGGVDGSA